MKRYLCSICLVVIGCVLACLAALSDETRPVGHEEVKPCSADKPLGGHIEITLELNQNGCRGSIRTVLRFPLVSQYAKTPPWPGQQFWSGRFSAPEVSYEMSTGGCSGTTVNGEETCNAPGGRKSGKAALDSRSGDGYLYFRPMLPEIVAVLLSKAGNEHDASTPLECIGAHSSGKDIWQFGLNRLFTIRPAGADCSESAKTSTNIFCVQPTVCANPADEATKRDCIVHADRYAVIPFVGEATWTSPKASEPGYSGFLSSKIHWEICCGCGAQSAPPEPTADPCPSTLEADRRLETNRKKREEKLNELDKVGAAYMEQLTEARAHYPDYEQTIKACLIQTLATKAIISLLAPEADVAGLPHPHDVEAAIELMEARGWFPPMGLQLVAKIVEKIVNGEDPTTALQKEGSQNWNETIAVLKKVETLMSGATAEEMEKSLEECQGAFLVSPETKLSADKCVESFKAALEKLAEFNKLANDIRDLDTEYPNLQYKAWAACVERARCKKTPESACADKKPSGNWPDVP